jgi:molybdopterin synthase catalytic subunit
VTSVSRSTAAVRLVGVRADALDVAEVTAAVSDPTAGGLTVFVGAVRDHDGGQDVLRLEYTAHPSAEQRLAEVATEVAEEFDVVAVAAVHRVRSRSATSRWSRRSRRRIATPPSRRRAR